MPTEEMYLKNWDPFSDTKLRLTLLNIIIQKRLSETPISTLEIANKLKEQCPKSTLTRHDISEFLEATLRIKTRQLLGVNFFTG